MSDQELVRAMDPATIGAAMRKGIMAFDAQLYARVEALRTLRDISGSTAIMSIVTPSHVIMANVGDSRAVFASDGRVCRATEDHKPQRASESQRVIQAGGYIRMGRVCGNLAVSRALGDFTYKEVTSLPPERQKISNVADIIVVPRGDTDDFLIVACDGIWDVVTNQQAVSFVSRMRRQQETPAVVAERLLDHCLKRGSTDNMSAAIIYFPVHNGKAGTTTHKRGTSTRRFLRGGPRASNDSMLSTGSVGSEADVVPQLVDHTRGRGSVSNLKPMKVSDGAKGPVPTSSDDAGAVDTGTGGDVGVGVGVPSQAETTVVVVSAPPPAALSPAAVTVSVTTATVSMSVTQAEDEDDVIPMKADPSRGRGSFVATNGASSPVRRVDNVNGSIVHVSPGHISSSEATQPTGKMCVPVTITTQTFASSTDI